MVVYFLWLVTSSYAVSLGTFPNAATCAMMAVPLGAELRAPPRAVLAEIVCMPSMILPGTMTRPAAPVRPERPSAES